ncbi:hypothetical protein B0H11DRAFT_2315926 [Mycena galericulata]|nr:hypothetical protein B0H11DRAFT_2315926 [Mycena galericulata]
MAFLDRKEQQNGQADGGIIYGLICPVGHGSRGRPNVTAAVLGISVVRIFLILGPEQYPSLGTFGAPTSCITGDDAELLNFLLQHCNAIVQRLVLYLDRIYVACGCNGNKMRGARPAASYRQRAARRGVVALPHCASIEGALEDVNSVHEEIVDIWNFHDPHELLVGQTFSDQIKCLAQRVTQDAAEEKSGPNLEDIQTLVGVGLGATVAAAAGPVIAGITLTGWFVQRMASVYDNTPKTLRCFMAYIVDLTLVLDQLFLVVLSIRPARPLTNADISMAFENYGSSNRGAVHREIREYVRRATVTQILQPTTAEEKVKELILKYCVDHNTK